MPMFTYFKKMYFSNIILGFLFCLTSLNVWANENEAVQKPAPTEAISTKEAPQESKSEKFDPGKLIMHHIADEHEWHFMTIGHTHITLPLPCIVYSESKGLSVFSSANFKNEHHEEVPYQGFMLSHGKIHAENGEHVYDFSITKNVASLLISAILLTCNCL